jgi:large subunit ribosomal protein L24
MSARIRQGDVVLVRSGADKGKRGKVIRVDTRDDRAVVEGVRLVFKHLKKSQKHPQGGRIRREAPIHLSKLALIDPTTDAETRVAFRTVDGKKVRVARKSGASLDGGGAPKAAKPGRKGGKEPKKQPKGRGPAESTGAAPREKETEG